MGKKFGRFVSYLLVIALVMQNCTMMVRAENGSNDGTGVLASEMEDDGEGSILDEGTEDTAEGETTDMEEISAEETVEQGNTETAEPETTGETVTDEEGSEPKENIPQENILTETVPEEIVQAEIVLDGTNANQEETDPVTGDTITYGVNLFGDTPFESDSDGQLSNWTEYMASVTSITASDNGDSVAVKINETPLGSDWGTGLKYTEDLGLTAGSTYKISYEIMSTVDRVVSVGFDGGQAVDEREEIHLKAGQTAVLEYEVTTTGAWSNFMFYLGNVADENSYGAHDITITNLSIREKKVQLAPGEKPEEIEGNLLVNGDFSEQDEDGAYTKGWTLNTDNANAKTALYKVAFDMTGVSAADWTTWLAQDVTLESSDSYKIAFDIESSIDRSIIAGFDGGMWFPHIDLSANEKKTVEYEVTGTTGGKFVIALGHDLRAAEGSPAKNQTLDPHRVVISNVRIVEIPTELPDTPNDTPYPEIANLKSYGGFTSEMMSPLKDGRFTRKMREGIWETWWESWMAQYDVVSYTLVDGGISFYIGNTGGGEGNKPWDVQLNQRITLARDTKYVLSFKVYSEKARSINVSISDIGDDGQAWVKPIAIQKGETREVILNLPEVPVDAVDKLFSIQMGNVSGEVLENTMIFTDMKIEVNGYSKLAGLITDGDFKDGTEGSFTVTGGENVDADFSGRYLKADIKKQCGEGDVALTSAELKLLSGQEYEVSFMAGATAGRSIKAAFVDASGRVLSEQQINLTTDTKKHTFTYMAPQDVTVRLNLSLGGSEEIICIDTIRCDIKGYPAAQKLDTEVHDIVLLEKKAFPVISEMTADEAIEGKNIILTFKKDDDYKNAIKAITVDGVEVAEDQYAIAAGTVADEYAIILDKVLFEVTGKRQVFDIVVKADWYQDNVIKQTIYRSQQWTSVWFEEFGGTELDLTKWSYQNGNGEEYGNAGWGNNEQQYYTSDNLQVTGGELVITAKKERNGSNDYTSARIWTMEDDQITPKFAKTYGRIEAKMKLVGGEGYEGIWPAFWMLPVDTSIYGGWPLSGEIDILETRGREPDKVDGTVHFGKPWPNNESKGGVFEFSNSQNNTDSDINDYHIYAVEWEPGEIRWYVDDELYFTFSNWYSQSADKPGKYKYPAPFDQNFYIILNLAVGGSFDNNLLPDDELMPVDMRVDYVRVYDSVQPYKEVTKEPAIETDEETDITTVKSELFDEEFKNIFFVSTDGVSLQEDVWNLVTLPSYGGSAEFKTITEDDQTYAKITPLALGNAAHSIQLIQNLTLVKGYNYRISFDARTDGKRKLNMKIGQDGTEGWDTHETFETTLGDTMQHYSYEFQANTTDMHARLEFNLGTSMQPVYIGTITYELIDEIVTEEDGRKQPCDDQNYVYNGSFNIGDIDGLTYWHTDDSDAKVVREGTEYVFTATMGNLYQYGLELLQNDSYELTFLVHADAERKIKISLTNISGKTIYKEEEATVGTESRIQKIEFTMPAGVSDRDAKLCFDFGDGGQKVYITDIFLKRITYNNIDWEEVNAYPLLNGDFELGDLYWSGSGDIGLTIQTDSDGRHYARVNAVPSANIWDRMLIYSDLYFTGKTDYIFSFDVRAGKETDALLLTMEDSGYYQHISKPNLYVGTDWTHYEYELRFTDDMDLALKFQLCGVSEACTMDFRNVKLSATGAPKEPGMIKADNAYNKLGEDVVFSYSGEQDWVNNAVVYVDGTTVAASNTVFKNGKLTLDAGVFTEPKVYTIAIKAEGYTPMPEQEVILYPMDGDRIYNGGFVYGLDGWEQYLLEEADTISLEDGKVKIHYDGARYDQWGNIVSWAIQLFREGIPVKNGQRYEISFIAYATTDRTIQLMRNQGSEISHYFQITTEPTLYEFEFDSVSDSLKLQFLLSTVHNGGGAITSSDILQPHDIYLDNICIKEVDSSGNVVADKTALDQLIKECETIEGKGQGDYTEETWKVFTAALKYAKEVSADEDVKQAYINLANDNLFTAKSGLAKPVTKDALQTTIEKYKDTERGDYTKTTWNVFQAALNTAKEVLEKETAKQDEVDAAAKKLEEAYEGLREMDVAVKAAKTALQQAIEQYQNEERGNYTLKSWNAFKAALKTAQDVAENEEESADRIEVVRENLEKAYAGLEENKAPADKSELEQLIELCDKVKRGDYTQETWYAFLAALDAAETVAKDEDAQQDEVDAAKEALEAAYRGLKEAGDGSGNQEITDKEGLWAVDIAPVTYTGKAIKPELIVYDGNTILKVGKDYSVSYKNNTKVGTATVTIKGKGNYTGSITKDFEIMAKNLADTDIAIADLYVMAPTGTKRKAVVPKPVVTRNGKKLKLNTEYTVECLDKTEGAYIEPGIYDVRISAVEGKGYTGSRVIKITLADPENQVLMSKASIGKISNQPYADGEKIEPEVMVKMGREVLILGQDYTVKYDKNWEVGTAEVIVKGTGEKYVGERRITFKITGTPLKASNVTLKDVPAGGYLYTGEPVRPQVSINGLVEDKDYTVEYQKNESKGTATVLVKGIGGYTGTVKKTFKIVAYNINTDSEQKFRIVSENIVVPYAKGKCKPAVEVAFGDTILKEGTDYTLSYKNNNKAGSTKQPEIYIKGKGNYVGTVMTTFTIIQQDIGNLTLTAADTLEKNAKKYNKANPVVTDLDGKKLKKGTDYIVTGYTYDNGDEIESVPKVGDCIRITIEAKEGGNYKGTGYAYFRIIENNNQISKATVTVKPQTYTGRAVEPSGAAVTVTIKVKNQETNRTETKTLTEGEDYEIVKDGYSKNISKGTGKLTVRGLGVYGGTKTVNFKIQAQEMSWADWYDKTAEYFMELFR